MSEGEYQARCARGARTVRVLGSKAHQQITAIIQSQSRGNGDAPEPTRHPLQLPVDYLLEKLFKYLTRRAHGADTPPDTRRVWARVLAQS